MALDDLLDEHEQGERVRSWLRDNGAGLIGGVVLGLGLIGGWQWWQKQREASRAETGARYEAALETLKAGDIGKAKSQIGALEGSIHATLAALDLAKAQVDAGQRDAAIATLRAAHTTDAALSAVIRQRLARLLVDAGKHDEAIELLAGADDAVALEVRGDAELASGKRDAARATYQQALSKLDVASPRRQLLELKLSEVGGAPAQPEART
jgi:predicted negative regulator of RcsB-dependent stress response